MSSSSNPYQAPVPDAPTLIAHRPIRGPSYFAVLVCCVTTLVVSFPTTMITGELLERWLRSVHPRIGKSLAGFVAIAQFILVYSAILRFAVSVAIRSENGQRIHISLGIPVTATLGVTIAMLLIGGFLAAFIGGWAIAALFLPVFVPPAVCRMFLLSMVREINDSIPSINPPQPH
ncbi:MAG: hypothetical protein R3C49_11315 [Planctomycetaceae bacterium]